MDYRLSLLTFFIGLIIGHRFALFRDRRKEFNLGAENLQSKIYDYLKSGDLDHLPTIKELTMFTDKISYHKKFFYQKAISELSASISKDKFANKRDPVTGMLLSNSFYRSQTKDLVLKVSKYLKRI
ncbi:hypothetical protein VCSRO191_1024 [Vibrio cholerae]|nr:hypothetical protein VCSRO191_1024 [Vibrio cholerae]